MAERTIPTISLNDFTSASQPEADTLPQRICLVGKLAEDEETLACASKFQLPVVCSATGTDFLGQTDVITYFIIDDFDSSEFSELHKLRARIFGKPAFTEMSQNGSFVTYKDRPVYSLTMNNCIIAFTGYKKKVDCSKVLKMVHLMGGSVKNEMTENVTHLLAQSISGGKYQYAITFNIPVMGEDWINACWAHRDEVGVKAGDEKFTHYRLKMFYNLRIATFGFSEEDIERMASLIRKNDGCVVDLDDESATHVVLEDQTVTEKPPKCPSKALVVKAEWFWSSIQMDACANEIPHLFETLPNLSATASPRARLFSPGGGGGSVGSRSRRRKRLRETVQQLAAEDGPSPTPSAGFSYSGKRRSSVGELTFMSADESFLEASLPSVVTPVLEKTPLSPPNLDLRQLSSRQRVFHELVKTECNYVAILDTINTVIKEPLEKVNHPGGPMLDPQELRYIFGNLGPIHEVHTTLRNELIQLSHRWTDDVSIGQVILKHMADIEKAYPPFVNYFENVKELLRKVTLDRPRFHAFLKIAQSKPECGRQSLQELLIRPVQRLPSMSLLISDILKHTDRGSLDHVELQEALDKIKAVMTFINDDKRKTEAKLKLFEIHNDIENCPPNLVASHRTYVSKVDVMELSDSCSGRGDSLSLFLFNDILEICKKKSKYNSLRSPSRVNLNTLKIKSYKHLEMMPLAHIKRVVDIRETEDCRNVFALIVRSNQELKERLYSFTIVAEDPHKSTFLRALCCNMANVVCRSDVENLLVSMDPHHLEIVSSEVSITNALNKALRFATRTGRKVSRAFSFSSKSPSSKLKRAVSSVMSPFGNGSSNGLRGATSVSSFANLPVTSGSPTSEREAMPAPITTTPTPKRRLPPKRFH